MKRNIFKFLLSLIVVISGISIGLIHANENELITPERAFDYSLSYLDDGVGKFIGKTTDEKNQDIDCVLRAENLYIFQYLRKDTKFPIHGEFVIVNLNLIPDYVDYTSDEYYAIKDTYWYYAKTTTEHVKIETISYFDLESNSAKAKLYVYLNFGDYTIDQINKIHIKYQLCYKEKYGFLWLKTRYIFDDFEHIITADSYEDFSFEDIGANVLILKNNYDLDGDSTLETLEVPINLDGKEYTHRVYALNIITSKEYFLSDIDESKTKLDIVDMYYIKAGVLCYTDGFDVIENNYNDKTVSNDKSLLENYAELIEKILLLILCIIIIYFVFTIIVSISNNVKNSRRKKE